MTFPTHIRIACDCPCNGRKGIFKMDELKKLQDRLLQLEEENQYLKSILDHSKIPYTLKPWEYSAETKETFDPNQGARIISREITTRMARYFFASFAGRTDVYARRITSKSGRVGYYPQCSNIWKKGCTKGKPGQISCLQCDHRSWKTLRSEIVMEHLRGEHPRQEDVIGIYPLLPNGTCNFIVFDFDNHGSEAVQTDYANEDEQWMEEVNILRKVCEENNIHPLVERSRSGKGAHLWILFKEPVDASEARRFGNALLHKGEEQFRLPSFDYYDRLFPTQEALRENGLGNLIALPLQGSALKLGNSAFVNENWNAYADQWSVLIQAQRLSKSQIHQLLMEWFPNTGNTVLYMPWDTDESFHRQDADGLVKITLANRIYVETRNLQPRLCNQIRRLATYKNVEFYKALRSGRKPQEYSRLIDLGETDQQYVVLPRGCRETLLSKLEAASISFTEDDRRTTGRTIHVNFKGELWEKQQLAADKMLKYEIGILDAATAFGKTVVSSYLIAQKKVSTLILVPRVALLEQWEKELERFLIVQEELPTYETKTGRIRKRKKTIGALHGTKDTTTGIIDIAMVGSAYRKGQFHPRLKEYGMIIVDECHHAASDTTLQVLNYVSAKYVYGVSATPERIDYRSESNYMLLGPIRHRFSAREQNMDNGLNLYVYPRFTRTLSSFTEDERIDIHKDYTTICEDSLRTELIAEDIHTSVLQGRTPLVLSRFKSLASNLYARLKDSADHVIYLHGDMTNTERHRAMEELEGINKSETLILISIGNMMGEGFNYPRLDTLFLTTPLRSDNDLTQYTGRVTRKQDGKKDVIIYDYVDRNIRTFERMYTSRMKTYQQLGYEILSTVNGDYEKNHNAIFDMESYLEVYEKDLESANNEIVISSPSLWNNKIERLLEIVREKQLSGLSVIVITSHPDASLYENSDKRMQMMEMMRAAGIHVYHTDDQCEHFAIIDRSTVWYGSLNFLGKEDIEDNLMRVNSSEIAAELLERTFGDTSEFQNWNQFKQKIQV